MSDEDTSTGVQLERVSNKNPLVYDQAPKKSTLRPDSAGMAVALNLHRPGPRKKDTGPRRKKEKRGGGLKKQATSTPTSPPSPPSPREGGEDDVDDDDLKIPASKEPAPSYLKSPSLEGSGEDIIEDDTDVVEEEEPDSEPADTSTTVVESSLSISMEKIARMKISWRQAAEGLLLALMAGCGAFLFALMSAKEPDFDLVTALGLIGFVTGVACIVSEMYTVTKEQKRRRRGQSQAEQPGTVSREDLVKRCSWWYVAACFVGSTSYTVLCTIYTITLADWTSRAAYLLLPIAATCWVLAVLLRPKDEGAVKILHLQFITLAIGSEVTSCVGWFRQGEVNEGLASLARIPFWLVSYWLALKLRRKAAQLPPAELSKFLCHTVLLGGVSAMAPMIFFMFEAVSCIATGDGLEDDLCENTTRAAMSLSVYLAITTAVAMASRTVPQEERGEGMTFSNLAILRLKVKEKVQGALGVVTALVAMYLFSVLGVEGAPNETIFWLGLAGAVTLLVADLIEGAYIAFGRSDSTVDDQAGPRVRASRSLSLSNIQKT